jgi:hypothetical protein
MSISTRKKEVKKEIKLWTLDCETRGLFGEVFRIGLYTESHNTPHYFVSNNTIDILDVLNEPQYREFENHVYIHNLDFDIAKIFREVHRYNEVDISKSLFINGNTVILATNNYIFHDSLRLLPSSLEKLSEDFGLGDEGKYDLKKYIFENSYSVFVKDKKGNYKYDNDKSKNKFFCEVPSTDKILNYYLEKDCSSLYKIVNSLVEISGLDIEELVKCPTTASLSMKVFKTVFPKDFATATMKQWTTKKDIFIEDTMLRSAYYGGRVEVFAPFMKNGFHYDVNSLYPYCMKTFKYPVGNYEEFEGEKAFSVYKLYKMTGNGGGFLECEVDVPDMFIPPLPVHHKSGKLIFPIGKLKGVWTFIELEKAEQMGVKICNVKRCVYFKRMEYIFKNFVEMFEEIKNTSKGAKRTFAKLVLNSLYGKHGMKRKRPTIVPVEKLAKLIENDTKYYIHRYDKNSLHIDFIETFTESKADYIQVQIASYVTSHARLVLLDGLLAQHEKGQVNYCDTDSTACKEKMNDAMVHDKEFGKWKLESEIESATFLQPKLYAEVLKELDKKGNNIVNMKAKGIPKSIMKRIEYNDYINWSNSMHFKDTDKIQIFDNVMGRSKFLSALKNEKDFDVQIPLRKSINVLSEQKRIVDYEGNTTKPHHIVMWGDNQTDIDFVYAKEKLELLKNYDESTHFIDVFLDSIGYIRVPHSNEKYYDEYNKLPYSVKKKVFKVTGVELENWCEIADISVKELIEEITEG